MMLSTIVIYIGIKGNYKLSQKIQRYHCKKDSEGKIRRRIKPNYY